MASPPAVAAATTFASELLGTPVRDPAGQTIGKVTDLLVPLDTDYPAVGAFTVRAGSREHTLPWEAVQSADRGAIVLSTPLAQAQVFQPHDLTLSLAHQVLDRQIIDTNGIRVVRANDLQLARLDGGYRLVGIDVSSAGLLRRLGVEKALSALRIRPVPRTIAWQDVEPVESGGADVKLRVSRADLARLRPADIADVLSQLDHTHGAEVLSQLADETAAYALGEMDEDLQVALIKGMDAERAADILEEMDPDEAADLLGDLAEDEPDRAEDLLGRMDREEAEDVRELLAYSDDCAGGLMTNEFVTVPADVTSEQAIALVRQRASDMGSVYYLYAMDPAERLIGVLSLRELIVAEPSTPIRAVMHTDLVVVHADDQAEEAARLVAKYNLLALPVVDVEGRLEGIVTVDDAMDIILPESWKARLPRVYRRAA